MGRTKLGNAGRALELGAVEAFEESKALREMARLALFTRPVGGAERRELAGRFVPAETVRWSGGMAEEGAVVQ